MLDYVTELTRDATRVTPGHHERLRLLYAASFTLTPPPQAAITLPQFMPDGHTFAIWVFGI